MKITRSLYWLSLSLIIVYTILRAWKVAPLFDEAASYFHYFMSGHIWDDKAILDANNHLFVSYWGNFWFKNGVDSFFFFRLLSVIGFIAYVFAWHILIVKQLKIKWGNLIVICCISIPWIIEYGALARGYSFAIACWLWMIVLIVELIKETKIWQLIVLYLLAWFSIFTSFTFTVPVFMLLGVVFVYFIWNLKVNTVRQTLSYLIISLLFLVAYFPLFKHSLSLKEGGFLWWGSTSGLWEVTGLSISKAVFFTDNEWVRIFLNITGLSALSLLITSLFKTHPKEWFKQPFHWITAYTIGIVLSLVVLAKVLNVNYPMDRVGMYLVPLFLLLFVFCIASTEKIKWGNLALLFFPATLVAHLNLSTTIFSPQDRITEKTYQKINEFVPAEAQFTAEWMAFILYNYSERMHLKPRVIALNTPDNLLETDYFLKTYSSEKAPLEGYRLIYFDTVASLGLYQKTRQKHRTVFEQKTIETYHSDAENSVFFVVDSTSEWTQKPFSLKIKGTFELPEAINELKFHITYTDKEGNYRVLQHNNLHHSFYPRTTFDFVTFTGTFPAMEPSEIIFNLENSQQKQVIIKNLEITLFNDSE